VFVRRPQGPESVLGWMRFLTACSLYLFAVCTRLFLEREDQVEVTAMQFSVLQLSVFNGRMATKQVPSCQNDQRVLRRSR